MGEILQDSYYNAQISVIGSMLVDDRCVPAVMAGMTAEDFTDGTCRSTYRAIQELALSGKPVDPVLVVDAVGGGETYVRWVREVMDLTPTAANVELYMDVARKGAALYRLREGADKLSLCTDLDEAQKIVREMSGLLSATSRMPRMTAAELARNFHERMSSVEKPNYLPWGIPTLNDLTYSELGDMILLGGYASAGKTLLSIQLALTQAKRYRVGYYTLETQPEKMADRMFSHLSGIPLNKIKKRDFCGTDWTKLAEAEANFVTNCPIDFIRAAGSSVDDIAMDAVGRGYQIIYVDYLQLIEAPGVRNGTDYARVTAVSRALKIFAQNTNTAVVALAQLSRPEKSGKGGEQKFVPPDMHSFRESGQIEQDADVAFLLWPEDPNDNQSRRVLKIGKNKEGRKKRITLAFDGATQTMAEIMEEDHPLSAAAQYIAAGKAVKSKNRAEAAKQMNFSELPGPGRDNPFA